MIVSRHTIITFVIRSTPFCNPMQQVPKPNAVTITIQKVISPGLERTAFWLEPYRSTSRQGLLSATCFLQLPWHYLSQKRTLPWWLKKEPFWTIPAIGTGAAKRWGRSSNFSSCRWPPHWTLFERGNPDHPAGGSCSCKRMAFTLCGRIPSWLRKTGWTDFEK